MSINVKRSDFVYLKPPLGVMPKYIWDEKRQEDLRQAIYRRINESYTVPMEWVEEYNALIKKEQKGVGKEDYCQNCLAKKHNNSEACVECPHNKNW